MFDSDTKKEDDTTVDVNTAMITVEPSLKGWSAAKGRFWMPNSHLDMIPAGVYQAAESQRIGTYLQEMKLVADDLVVLPSLGMEAVLAEIQKFWSAETRAKFKQFGFTHKRGILLHGEPGTGKTSLVHLLIDQITKLGGIVFPNVQSAAAGIPLVRNREPDREILVVLEDIDTTIKGGGEQLLLNMLDGQLQTSGVVFLATTNYPESLPPRISARPSRFDLIIEIGAADEEARYRFMRSKVPADVPDAKVREWAKASGDLPISYLKELVILCLIYDYSTEDALARLSAIRKKKLLPEQAALTMISNFDK